LLLRFNFRILVHSFPNYRRFARKSCRNISNLVLFLTIFFLQVILQTDIWHKSKNIKKDFRKTFRSAADKAEAESNDITGEKIVSHLLYSIDNADGDPDKLFQSFTNSYKHYRNKCNLSKPFKKKFREFVRRTLSREEASQYTMKLRTDYEEGFHRASTRYWRKGNRYEFINYKARQALHFLDWCENFKKEKRTIRFRRAILDRFEAFLSTRSCSSSVKPLTDLDKFFVSGYRK